MKSFCCETINTDTDINYILTQLNTLLVDSGFKLLAILTAFILKEFIYVVKDHSKWLTKTAFQGFKRVEFQLVK